MDAMEQRRNRIVDFINARNEISFQELKNEFPQVSEMTLRTDLKALDEEKKIIRVHGGAKAVTTLLGNDDLLTLREVRNISQKEELVEKALRTIRPNTTIFLDSGSTTTMLARLLPDQPMMIFTNSLTCASELSRMEQAEVFVVGGSLNTNSKSLYGQTAIEELGRVRFDQAFMGVTGVDEKGFNCGHAGENALKRFMVSHADETVLLMDASKVGKSSTFTFCTMEDADTLIADDALPEAFRKQLQEANVKVI